MAFDPSARTDLVAHFDDLTANQAEKCRMVICGQDGMTGPDAATIMQMLGIFPGKEEIDTGVKPLTEMLQPIQK